MKYMDKLEKLRRKSEEIVKKLNELYKELLDIHNKMLTSEKIINLLSEFDKKLKKYIELIFNYLEILKELLSYQLGLNEISEEQSKILINSSLINNFELYSNIMNELLTKLYDFFSKLNESEHEKELRKAEKIIEDTMNKFYEKKKEFDSIKEELKSKGFIL